MQKHLAQVLARIVRVRTDDKSTLKINLFDDVAAAKFERAGLAACCQKLQQVRDTHRVQSSVNSHQVILFCNSCENGRRSTAWNRGQAELRPTIQTLTRLQFRAGKFQVETVPGCVSGFDNNLTFCQVLAGATPGCRPSRSTATNSYVRGWPGQRGFKALRASFCLRLT